MDAKTGFFYLFSVVLLFAAFRVVTARNPVHAVLNLILAFSQAAGIWLLLKAEFLGVTLVLVYLGVEIAAVILLVAMIAAIALTLRKRKDSKAVNPAQQIRVRAKDRLELVKVPVTQAPQAPAAEATPAVETKA